MTANVKGQRHDRSALVLYGSETGNSQDVAEELGRVAERLHFMTRVCEMDLVEINILFKFTVVIFVVSTTGQGEFPKNSRRFWKSLLRKRLPPRYLSQVTFTSFGLGDSSYPQFNWSARKLHKRLEQLGANEIYPRGEADDQHEEGIDGGFLSWSADFQKNLLILHPLPPGVTPISAEELLPPKYTLALMDYLSSPPRTQSVMDVDSEYGVPSPFELFSCPEIQQAPKINLLADATRPAVEEMNLTWQPKSLPGRDPPERPDDMPSDLFWKPTRALDEFPPCDQLKGPHPGEEPPVDFESDERLLPIPHGSPVTLYSNQRVTPDNHWQDVRELTFTIAEDELEFNPGDSIQILPKNFPEDVQTLINLMDWNDVADKVVRFEAQHPDFFADEMLITLRPRGLIPLKNATLRDLLIHNLDFNSIPNRYFFELASHHTQDQTHRERLREFANPAFTDEFYDYTSRPRRSILEVLQDFPTVKLPWKWAVSIFPVIRPRAYSIANGGRLMDYPANKGLVKIQILVALVKYRTVLKKIRQGLCSRYLASLDEGTPLKIFYDYNHGFYERASKHQNAPILAIATGTGIAPVRAMLWHRMQIYNELTVVERMEHEDEAKIGSSLLIFGCRNMAADCFYKEEWGQLRPILSDTRFAASRDQPKKLYVQDIIRACGANLAPLIFSGKTIVYVCGSSGAMPNAVRLAIIDILFLHIAKPRDMPREEVERFVKELEKSGRYVQETW